MGFDYRRIFRFRRDRPADRRDELDEELRTHLELRAEEYEAQGMSPEEAWTAAERRFGDVESARRRLYTSASRRDVRLRFRRGLEAVGRDLRVAFRKMRRSPGYAGVSVLILAVSLALTTVMFTLVDHVLLRPLPFPDQDRLVSLRSVGEAGTPYDRASMANWFDWRAASRGLAATGLSRQDRASVAIDGEAFRATVAAVGGDFFEVFRPRARVGRLLTAEDGQEVRQVTVLAPAFAASRFGTADQALGRTVSISGRPYEVVGVLERGQEFPEGSDLWVAFHVNAGSGVRRNDVNFRAYGRLAEDAELALVRSELDAVARGIRETDPEGAFHSHGVAVDPLRSVLVADAAQTLWLLMAAVLVVLLLACANLAGLGLARARMRVPEVSVRMALGSGRTALVRQLLVEHLTMAALGGVLGLLLASAVGRLVFPRLAGELPRTAALQLDLRVALFALALTLGAGLLAGVGPALRTSRLGALESRGRVRGGRGLPGGTLVAVEIGLALAVLVGGGLLFRSLQAVAGRDLGYDPRAVAVAEVDLNGEEYRSGELAVAHWNALLSDLEDRPGIAATGVANWIPTGPAGTSFLAFPDNPDPDFGAGYRVVSAGYFEAMGIGLRRGRHFEVADDLGTERVALVNQALAELAWPDQDPLGRSISAPSMEGWLQESDASWLRVVGVVDDIRHGGHEDEAQPQLYVLYRQVPRMTRGMHVVARAEDSERATLPATLRQAIRASDASLAVEVSWLGDRVSELLRERIWTQRILGGFGLAALALVCLGIYGVVAHAAAQRTREIAVRAALGARRSGLLGLMLGGAARVLALGTALGLVAAYGITGLMESLLVDVPATDPVSFVAAVAILAAVGLLAALVPSVRAARMDPTEALRSE